MRVRVCGCGGSALGQFDNSILPSDQLSVLKLTGLDAKASGDMKKGEPCKCRWKRVCVRLLCHVDLQLTADLSSAKAVRWRTAAAAAAAPVFCPSLHEAGDAEVGDLDPAARRQQDVAALRAQTRT